MSTTYIIFRKRDADKHAEWVETIEGLEKAKKRFQHYTANSAERHFVFDVHEAKIVNILTKTKSA